MAISSGTIAGKIRAMTFVRTVTENQIPVVDITALVRGEAAADVGEEVHVDIVEDTLTHEERLGGDLLLCNARPEQQRSVDIFSLHDLFHGEGPHDINGLTRVVAFAVPRSHSKDRIAIRHAGLLI